MSLLFDSYESELKQAIKKAKNVINHFQMGSESEKQNSIRIIKEKIREAEVNYNKMESEYAIKDQSTKALLKKKVDAAYKEVDETRKRFIKLESDHIDEMNRNNLMKEASKKEEGTVMKEKNERLYAQNAQFSNLNKIANETAGITSEANVRLLEQRDLMITIKDRNADIEQDLDRIDKLTLIMGNRELFNKAILWAVVILLFITNLIVFYLKARRLFG